MSKTTPETKAESYKQTVEEGTDVSLRRKVAGAIAGRPRTTHELTQEFEDRSANAIRPRVNELIRMGCVDRTDTRENPSGHEANVLEITATGLEYLDREIDPDPGPPMSELKTRVLDRARELVQGEIMEEELEQAVRAHDAVKKHREPGWEP